MSRIEMYHGYSIHQDEDGFYWAYSAQHERAESLEACRKEIDVWVRAPDNEFSVAPNSLFRGSLRFA